MPAAVTIKDNWPSIDIGRLRHPITIYAIDPTGKQVVDASGVTPALLPFATAMAAIEAVRGSELIKSGQNTTQLFLTVSLWFIAGILPDMQVVTDGGSTYVIQSVENVLELGVVMVLNCLGLGANT